MRFPRSDRGHKAGYKSTASAPGLGICLPSVPLPQPRDEISNSTFSCGLRIVLPHERTIDPR
jgi:hypothetical protein